MRRKHTCRQCGVESDMIAYASSYFQTRRRPPRTRRPGGGGSRAVAVLGFTFGGGSGVAIIAAGGHGPILPQ